MNGNVRFGALVRYWYEAGKQIIYRSLKKLSVLTTYLSLMYSTTHWPTFHYYKYDLCLFNQTLV